MDNKIVRGVILAFVRVHVLHHATKGRIFGLAMIEELRHHGYTLSPGTLYPIFHSMEEAGYLRSADEVVNGKLTEILRGHGERTAAAQTGEEQDPGIVG